MSKTGNIHCRATEDTIKRLNELIGSIGTDKTNVIEKLIFLGEKIKLAKDTKLSNESLIFAIDFLFETHLIESFVLSNNRNTR